LEADGAAKIARSFWGAADGLYDGEKLEYVGSVGTGFDRAMLEKTAKTLLKLETSTVSF